MSYLQVQNAVAEALRLVGHTPDTYDVDAVIGTLGSRGVMVMTSDDIEAAMFQDRCDFECSVCHPEDDS